MAAPRTSKQLDQALEARNQLHETSDEPQRVEQAMSQASVPKASKKRGRPPAEESERRCKEREAALAAKRAEMPPVRRSERRTCTRRHHKFFLKRREEKSGFKVWVRVGFPKKSDYRVSGGCGFA